jgi:hypothetical protein
MRTKLALLILGSLLVSMVSTTPMNGMIIASYLRSVSDGILGMISNVPAPLQEHPTQGRNWGNLDKDHQPVLLDRKLRAALEVALSQGVSKARLKYRSELLRKAQQEVESRMSRGEVTGRLNRQVEIGKIVNPKMAEFDRRLRLAGPPPGDMDQRGQAGGKSSSPTPPAQTDTGGTTGK